MSHALIIVGAGSGERLGAGVPKALVELGGCPMILRALDAFTGIMGLNARVLVLPASVIDPFREEHGAALVRAGVAALVPGGARRQDSVLAGIRAAPADAELALVHDAARPFVSRKLIEGVIDAAILHGAAVPVISPADTMALVRGDGFLAGREDRSRLRAVQTPQAARRDLLLAALENAGERVFTDESAALLASGARVFATMGSPGNIKITTPEDLETARLRIEKA